MQWRPWCRSANTGARNEVRGALTVSEPGCRTGAASCCRAWPGCRRSGYMPPRCGETKLSISCEYEQLCGDIFSLADVFILSANVPGRVPRASTPHVHHGIGGQQRAFTGTPGDRGGIGEDRVTFTLKAPLPESERRSLHRTARASPPATTTKWRRPGWASCCPGYLPRRWGCGPRRSCAPTDAGGSSGGRCLNSFFWYFTS